MKILKPIDNLMDKLQQDLDKQKEKAEKTAKLLDQSASKKRQAVENKENKKKRKQAQQSEDPLAQVKLDKENAEAELKKLQHSAEEDKHIQEALDKALASCKMPETIPINVCVASAIVPVDKSARSEAMMAALQKAKNKLATANTTSGKEEGAMEESASSLQVGLQAAVEYQRRQGNIATKKKKGTKDEKSMVTADLRKIGKHLLK